MKRLHEVITQILEDEGGIAQLPGEPFITRFGQTPDWLDQHDFIPPKTVEQAYANYVAWLTRKTKISLICDIAPYVGYLIADWAVLSGEAVAVKALQRELKVEDDGIIGPETLGALRLVNQGVIARGVLAAHNDFVGTLVAATKDAKGNPVDRRKFVRSWNSRIARQIRRLP
jgi:lysozyme family protein